MSTNIYNGLLSQTYSKCQICDNCSDHTYQSNIIDCTTNVKNIYTWLQKYENDNGKSIQTTVKQLSQVLTGSLERTIINKLKMQLIRINSFFYFNYKKSNLFNSHKLIYYLI
jgi:hypothetical protein